MTSFSVICSPPSRGDSISTAAVRSRLGGVELPRGGDDRLDVAVVQFGAGDHLSQAGR
jgi:hypothetical protein